MILKNNNNNNNNSNNNKVALKHQGEFSELEIEGFKRELQLLPAPLEVINPGEISEPVLTSVSPIQQLQLPKELNHSESLSDVDDNNSTGMRQTIPQYMKIDFQHRTTLPN